MSSNRGAYLASFSAILSGGNRSLHYVNSINCIVISGVELCGGFLSCGLFIASSISGFSLALYWHGLFGHVHGSS
jgi:hypothetical protein